MLEPARTFGVLALLFVLLPTAASAQGVDWARLASDGVVEILTKDADGDTRTTKIWIVLVDDHAYIRTGSTRWVKNLEHEPLATLRAADAEYPVRVEFIEDEALRDRVEDAFRAKYGFSDRIARLMHFGGTRIMRLEPRPAS